MNGQNKVAHLITRRSPFSKKDHTMTIVMDIEDYNAWNEGALIQNALPYLAPDEREFLMTGITPDEWNNTFSKEDARSGGEHEGFPDENTLDDNNLGESA